MLIVEVTRLKQWLPLLHVDVIYLVDLLAFLDDVWAKGPHSSNVRLRHMDCHQPSPVQMLVVLEELFFVDALV